MQGRKGNIEISKQVGQLLLSGCTYATAAPAFPSVAATPPAIATATGTATIDVGKNTVLDVMFAGTSANDQTFDYLEIGWIPVRGGAGQGYLPVKVAAGTVTLSSLTLGTAGAFLEGTGSFIADTITETTACPLSQAYSPADNTPAHLILDVSQFHYVTILVSRKDKTAATMDVIATLGDSLGASLKFDPDVSLGAVTVTSGAITASGAVTNTATMTTKVPTVLTKTVTTAGTGVPLVAAPTLARSFWLTAKKATGVNTGAVYIGTSTVDKTTDQQTVLEPNDYLLSSQWIPSDVVIDLANICIDSDNNGDGVTGGYIPA